MAGAAPDRMSSLWLDIRYALRMMVKAPGLTAVLIITLALGIGASTTIFSVVSSVVLKPLPYLQPDRLARVYTEFNGKLKLERFWMSAPEFDDLTRACRSCASVAGWINGSASLAGGDRPVRIEAAYVTHQLLPMLGIRPLLGRWFDASDERPGGPEGDPEVVVLGYDVWQRAFAGDPGIIGRKIHLDAIPVTVIGVMPKGFDFLDHQEAWVPVRLDTSEPRRGRHFVNTIVRLAPGASLASLQAELAALVKQWGLKDAPAYHAIASDHPMIALGFQDDVVGSLSTTLWLLQCAVLFVLLISIVNVANLLLARSETRTREVAVRHALGASHRRLIRQFMTESLILGLLGGALGILVAVWAVDGVTALLPTSAPRASEIELDAAAVGFAVVCSIAAALLFGLAPILHARRTDLHGALKDGSGRMTGSRARLRVRRALVITEIALAVMLVIGCTVMVRSFIRLQHVELGFQPGHMLTFGIELPEKAYPGVQGDEFWRRHLERMRALPGVTDVALLSGMLPSRPINANDFEFVDRTRGPDDPPWNVDYWQVVGDGTLEALGARIVRGRSITRADVEGAPAVIVINEAFAAKFFPHEDPIGRQITVRRLQPPAPSKIQTIVGVVADLKQAGLDKPAGTEVFVPLAQYATITVPASSRTTVYTLLRTPGDPAALIPSVQHAVAGLDPTLPMFEVRTMDDVLWEAIARPRFLTLLLTAFGALALLLAAVGIYGVMSHTVAQRTHEIGLRVALGAQPSQVRAMVLRQASTLVATGVAVGLALAIGLEQILAGSLHRLFYGEQLDQPLLLAAVAITVAATALLATWIPARRATRVEPTVALRSE
jgi:putative ABC transport system permease protein